MAFVLTWAPAARLDFWEILSYIADSDPGAAHEFGRKLLGTVGRLPDFPQSGRIVPEFNDPMIREVIRKPCRVVYRLKSEEQLVQIARIWHAARGIPEL